MNQKIIFAILTFLLLVFKSTGQTTPDELARVVFNSFQMNDLSKLDTLIPTIQQIFEISTNMGLDVKEASLKENYEDIHKRHFVKFKEKCSRFISDTTIYAIDWSNSSFDTSIRKEKEINLTVDSPDHSKKIKMVSLDILFTDKKNKYLIGFRDIYYYNGVWKIGDNVKVRRIDEDEY